MSKCVRSERLSLSLGTSEAANDLTESKASRPFRGGRIPQKATVVGADVHFFKYFSKYLLPAMKEKFPESSPVWGLEGTPRPL